MTDEQLQRISDRFITDLKNKDLEMSPRVVGFSAINGSGKTTITDFLESKGFLNPSAHELRLILAEEFGNDYDRINEAVLVFFRGGYSDAAKKLSNKSLVIDSNLDRNHEIFFKNYSDLAAAPFIIRIDLPIEVNLKRLRAREKDNPKGLAKILSNLPQYIKDHEEFGKKFSERFNYTIPGDITEEVLEDLHSKILAHKFN